MQPRRVVLLGFMAAGKTEVGTLLASRLGWRHVDIDREIESAAGCSIEEIFRTRGEAEFRSLEVRLTPAIVALERIVVSPGGGWITNEGLFASLPSDTLTAWLKVSPEEVLRRLTRSPAQSVRPLLRSGDPQARIQELLSAREPLYRQAQVVVDTDSRSIEQIVDILEKVITGQRAGPPQTGSTKQNGS